MIISQPSAELLITSKVKVFDHVPAGKAAPIKYLQFAVWKKEFRGGSIIFTIQVPPALFQHSSDEAP